MEIEQFGHAKADWFATFMDLSNGIPYYGSFRQVFAQLVARRYETCFPEWMRAVAGVLPTQVTALALGGKTLRRPHNRVAG